MVGPRGAVHVPYRGAMRVAKRLGIDFAEAVVDFEFGHRMAVPVIQGVVIAEEHHDRVMEELAKDEAEKRRKEDEKRRKAALAMWRRFLMGMRIVERIKQDYGHVGGEGVEAFRGRDPVRAAGEDEDVGGGFLPEEYEDGEEKGTNLTSGFFPVVDDDDGAEDMLEVDHGEGVDAEPISSVLSAKPRRKTGPKSKKRGSRRRRRHNIPSRSEEEDDEGGRDEYELENSEDD